MADLEEAFKTINYGSSLAQNPLNSDIKFSVIKVPPIQKGLRQNYLGYVHLNIPDLEMFRYAVYPANGMHRLVKEATIDGNVDHFTFDMPYVDIDYFVMIWPTISSYVRAMNEKDKDKDDNIKKQKELPITELRQYASIPYEMQMIESKPIFQIFYTQQIIAESKKDNDDIEKQATDVLVKNVEEQKEMARTKLLSQLVGADECSKDILNAAIMTYKDVMDDYERSVLECITIPTPPPPPPPTDIPLPPGDDSNDGNSSSDDSNQFVCV